MKKSVLFTFMLACISGLTAQITVNRNHVVSSGQIVVQATDTNTMNIQTAGTNKTWDFSGLKKPETDTLKFNPPQWFPGHTYFPNANMAVTFSSDDSSYMYLKVDNSELSLEGTCDIAPDTTFVSPFKRTMLTFPSTYNTTFNKNFSAVVTTFPLGFDPDSTGPIPYIDSIRVSSDIKESSVMNGWGSATTPLGTYNVLMQTITTISGVKLEMYTSNIWVTVPNILAQLLGFGNIPTDTSYTHNFWTNDATVAFPLVTYDYAPGDNTTSNVQWLETKPQTNGVNSILSANANGLYPNPCHNAFTVRLSNDDKVICTITDVNGKTLKNLAVTNGAIVDMSELSNGVYTIRYVNVVNGAIISHHNIVKF